MPVTLTQLLVPQTKEQVLAALLAKMATKGLPTNDWHSGSLSRTHAELVSEIIADYSASQPLVAGGSLLEYSKGNYLTLFTRSNYKTTRKSATFATGTITLNDAGGGPHTIAANSRWFQTSTGLRFFNTSGGTLVLNGSLVLNIKAESVGSAYNVAANAINQQITPLPGVSITASVINATGADEETDEQLAERANLIWATLAVGATKDTYKKWALDADADVRRVKVEENLPSPGGVKITLARQDGTIAGNDSTNVSDYINQRRPLCAQITVQGATELTQNFAAAISVQSAYLASAEAAVLANIDTLLRSKGIGETFYLAEFYEALMTPPGVVNVSGLTPSADVVLTAYQVLKKGTTAGLVFTGV